MNAGQQERHLQAIRAGLLGLMLDSGSIDTLPALYNQFVPDEVKGRPADYFDYNIDFLSLVQGTSETGTFTVERDSDFLITNIVATVEDAALPETAIVPNGLTVEMRDTGSGRNLQNQATAFQNVIGTGQLPAYMPTPKFINAASNFSLTVANGQSGAGVPLLVRVAFVGIKIFGYSPE